ncbi:hypothetical protein SAMN05216489_05053 [Streptomyces sp. 3213]|nr:hypothetical protein SAMN05216489_05053 [Streptomyces sp. 3213] [Streptomyces sp. 3213.3]
MSARYVRGFCAAVIAVAALIGAAAASPAKAADRLPAVHHAAHSGGSIMSLRE